MVLVGTEEWELDNIGMINLGVGEGGSLVAREDLVYFPGQKIPVHLIIVVNTTNIIILILMAQNILTIFDILSGAWDIWGQRWRLKITKLR